MPSIITGPYGDTLVLPFLSFGHTEGAQSCTQATGRQAPDGQRGPVTTLTLQDPAGKPTRPLPSPSNPGPVRGESKALQ